MYISSAFGLQTFVGRSRKCLDFGSTINIFHLILCTFYAGFPTNFTWWFINISTATITVTFGEWLCIRKEMEAIPAGSNSTMIKTNKEMNLEEGGSPSKSKSRTQMLKI